MRDDQDDDGSDVQAWSVPEAMDGFRLDKALAMLCPEYSRSRLKLLIDSGDVFVDGMPRDQASLRVTAGQVVSFSVPAPVAAEPLPEDIPLTIVYEDDDLLVIDKQAGLVVHPGSGNWTGTLVNALLHHCGDTLSGIGGVVRPGIVHRLDKETSGLMVVAKNDAAHRGLAAQLEDRSLSRTYTALVWKVPQAKGVVDKPIARHATQRTRMMIALREGGRAARTHYRRLSQYGAAMSLVECALETGRTHQIRVHMQSIGHPLVGDTLYGIQANAGRSLMNKSGFTPEAIAAVEGFPRQALHASAIRFLHPRDGVEMTFDSSLPADMAALLKIIE